MATGMDVDAVAQGFEAVDMKTFYESEIQRIRKEHQKHIQEVKEKNEDLEAVLQLVWKDLQQLKCAHRQELDKLRVDNEGVITQIEKSFQEDAERSRVENQRILNQMQHLHKEELKKTRTEKQARSRERELQSFKKSNESILQELKANHTKELQSLKKSHEFIIQQMEADFKLERRTLSSCLKASVAALEKAKTEYEKAGQDYRRKNAELQRDKQELEETIQFLQTAAESRERQLKLQQLDIARLQTERDDLIVRLSKVASDKLTTGNASISDLSDEFRPTKLSELFSELYDNQWTDAYDELSQGLVTDEPIQYLLDIVFWTQDLCSKTVQSSAMDVRTSLTGFRFPTGLPFIAGRSSDGNKNTLQECLRAVSTLQVPVETWKTVADFRKSSAYSMLDTVLKTIVEIFERQVPLDNMPETRTFLEESSRVCWLMALQDPPVAIDTSKPYTNGSTPFDKDKYRAYTKSGNHLDFIVWPALYLHSNGPLLSKGVAQGKQGATDDASSHTTV